MKRKMFCITSFLDEAFDCKFCCNVNVGIGVSVRRISLVPMGSCLSSVPNCLVP